MRDYILDELDRQLIAEIEANPGSSIPLIAAPFWQTRRERTIRERVERLSKLGKIRIYRAKPRGMMRCYPQNWPLLSDDVEGKGGES